MKPCPQCSSDQLKKASLVYEEGVRAGAGVGVGTGGIGVAAGASVSVAAARCAPPTLDKNAFMHQTGSKLLLIFFVPLLIAGMANGSWSEIGWFWKLWAGCGFALIVFLASKFDKQQKATHEKALAQYDRTYVCLLNHEQN